MGKFKEFLLTEEIGLADLGPRIDHLMNSQWFGNQIAGALVSSDVSGSEQSPTLGYAGHSLHLPSTDLTIPSVTKEGRITTLLLKKNPIYVRLSDGTEAHFSYDEYRKIDGEPALGKVMTITFQRHPDDTGRAYSKIDKAIVRN
jgi:hypothetical protein